MFHLYDSQLVWHLGKERKVKQFTPMFIEKILTSVADPDPEGSDFWPDPDPINVSDPKNICRKEPYFQAEIR